MLLMLGVFGSITLISRGGFGFGDTLILTTLGWYIGSMMYLKEYLILLTVIMIGWGISQVLLLRLLLRKKTKHKTSLLKNKETLPIDKITPGMILADDYFMRGLTEKEIKKLKTQGIKELTVKHAYPFIPVIFISFLIYFLNSLITF